MSSSHSSFHHQSVLLSQTVESVCSGNGSIYLDGTLGGGGHTKMILEREPLSFVIGIDRDQQALEAATQRLQEFGERFFPLHGCFADMKELVEQATLPNSFEEKLHRQDPDIFLFDGILLDLGVSSPQLDHPDRGFSFSKDGPVDMRMDRSHGIPARDFLQTLDQDQLADILYHYGEEPRSRRIAKAIIEGNPWESTIALADCISRASGYKNSKTHPATRTFQAIRIAVNSELEQLEMGLQKSISLIKEGGILSVISFHSLEDRMVKDHFRFWAGITTPRDIWGHSSIPVLGTLIHKKGLSGKEHDSQNVRSRSARLRCFQRNQQKITPEHILVDTQKNPYSPPTKNNKTSNINQKDKKDKKNKSNLR